MPSPHKEDTREWGHVLLTLEEWGLVGLHCLSSCRALPQSDLPLGRQSGVPGIRVHLCLPSEALVFAHVSATQRLRVEGFVHSGCCP